MENKKIKDLYDYDMVSDADENNIANEWFNVLMEKYVCELSIGDICRMLRQKIFSVVAIDKAIEILNTEPFVGDLYEGQLMVNLCNAKEKYLSKRYEDMKPLLETSVRLAISHEWKDEEEKREYLECAIGLQKKIKEQAGVLNES